MPRSLPVAHRKLPASPRSRCSEAGLRWALLACLLAMGCSEQQSGNSDLAPTVFEGDGASLSIPAGALADPGVDIRVQEVPAPQPAPDGRAWLGGVFAFTPHGTQFLEPATIALPLGDDLDVDQSDIRVVKLGSDDDTEWITVPGVLLRDGLVLFETSSLSYYGALTVAPEPGDDDSSDDDDSAGPDEPLGDDDSSDDDDSSGDDPLGDDDDSAGPEDCSNGLDDDGDADTDCADADCVSSPLCAPVLVSVGQMYTLSFDTMESGLTFSTGMNSEGYLGGDAGMFDVLLGVDMEQAMGLWNSSYDLDLVTYVDGVIDVSTTSLSSLVNSASFVPGSMATAHSWQSFTPTVEGTIGFELRASSPVGGQFGGSLYLGQGCASSTPLADWSATVSGTGVAEWVTATVTPR